MDAGLERRALERLVLERRALEALDEALLLPDDRRASLLAELERSDARLADRVRSLLAAEEVASRSLPTEPPAPPARAAPLPPPERVGVYRIVALLGEGGMGTVWRGERDDGLFNQTVAVKLMRPELFAGSAAAQFTVERQVLARLRHPNIAQLFDGGTDEEGRAYFVMELVEGVPLTDFVGERDLDLAAAAALLEPVCAAVQHAHGNFVVHADIKPGNILVDAEGRPKLLDFGIARSFRAGDEEGAGGGLTPAYASPERRAGGRPTPADDIYALGAVLRELASGAPPDTAPPPPLGPPVPGEFAAVIAKACAAAPQDRYESPLALGKDLRRWLDGFPVAALPRSGARSARLFVRRRPFTAAATIAALVGLVAALAVISVLYLRSEAERREADARFGQARGMAHYMLFDLFDRLTDTPGTLELRRDLAKQARIYLHDMSSAPRAPLDVRAEAAVGYMQLAGVEGLFAAGQLGERGQARKSLEAAERLLGEGGAEAFDDSRWLYADGRLKMFQGFRTMDAGGGAAAAAPLLREAVERLARAAARLSDDPQVAADLWQARLTLADMMETEGDFAGAVGIVREAVAAYDETQAVLDRSATTPLLIARSYKLIGQAQDAAGDKTVAVKAFTMAQTTLAEEEARRPRRSRTLLEGMDVRWNLAGTLAGLGRSDEALALLDEGIASGEARLAIEPDHNGLVRMTGLLRLERARLLMRLGRGTEALAAARAELGDRAARRAAAPGDIVAQREYLGALRPLAEIEAAAGSRAAACERFGEAQEGYDAFVRDHPSARQTFEPERAAIRAALGRCAPPAVDHR